MEVGLWKKAIFHGPRCKPALSVLIKSTPYDAKKTLRAFGLDEDVDDIIGDTFIQRSHIRDPSEAACLANRARERARREFAERERERKGVSEGARRLLHLFFKLLATSVAPK
jgi:hypothetical protein